MTHQKEWISSKKSVPQLLEGKNYSKNVLAVVNGELNVMCYIRVHDGEECFYGWANCYGDIDGEGEFDDDYAEVIWMDFPELPKK
jgi:hypothetical protein